MEIARAIRRANGRAKGRVGGKPRVLRDIVKAFRRPHRFARCRFVCPTGTAVSQGLSARGRTAHGFQMGRVACDVPHRHATRSWPKVVGNRLYGSLSMRLGISADMAITVGWSEVLLTELLWKRATEALSASNTPSWSSGIARTRSSVYILAISLE